MEQCVKIEAILKVIKTVTKTLKLKLRQLKGNWKYQEFRFVSAQALRSMHRDF